MKKTGFTLLLIFAVFALMSGSALVRFWTEWMWFLSLGFKDVMIITLLAKVKLGLLTGSVFFLALLGNLFLADILSRTGYLKTGENTIELPGAEMLAPAARSIAIIFSAFLAFIIGAEGSTHWFEFLTFRNPTSFGIADPLLGLDVSFYVFKFPFYQFLYRFTISAIVFSIIVSAFVYTIKRGFVITETGISFRPAIVSHVSVLAALAFIVKAFGYRLMAAGMLFTSRSFVEGPGYTDVTVRLPLINILFIASLIAAAMFAVNAVVRNWKLPAATIIVIALVSTVAAVYPEVVQRLRVSPNEISLETEYIQHQIDFTRKAYGLDSVRVVDYPLEHQLTAQDISDNDLTVKNIRLWDSRPLLQTYQQLQEIRTYYSFTDVDIDRYEINGEVRQVMLSARELAYDKLPNKTWVNSHLSFTHGYGVCMSPVNHFTAEGMPEFFIKNIPPIHTTDIKLDMPQIYFGELSSSYIFTKTKADEFDYPQGDDNVFTSYEGSGGVVLDSWFKKLAFALRFSSLEIVLNTDISKDSRVMIYRNVTGSTASPGRAARIMPILQYDWDPYIVISDGRLKWIIDAYTHSSTYPYSEPVSAGQVTSFNYIRNTVKVVIDAYDGTVEYYAFDQGDPIIQTYMKIFPGVFKSISDMPPDLRSHIRYPELQFQIQAYIYSTYQMTDPGVFYNREDIWNFPRELFFSSEIRMDPYYTVMRLPEEDTEEFILMLPFTPRNRDNLSAWMCARNDGDNYGKLLVFKFPKEKTILGPFQIEARIDQEPEISRQLSLWSQKGSQIIRGNLLVIPIEDSLLYVEPLFLKAEKGEIPELKRVIVSDGNRVVMEPTLELALEKLLGRIETSIDEAKSDSGNNQQAPDAYQADEDMAETLRRALYHLRSAKQEMKDLNWEGFGKEFELLEQSLQQVTIELPDDPAVDEPVSTEPEPEPAQ